MLERGGIVGRFAEASTLVRAARQARIRGYAMLETYSPFSSPEITEALGHPASPTRKIMFAAGAIGLCAGLGMQAWSAAVAYPLNSGGRPLMSWPSFIPVTFEIAVLCAALAGFACFLWRAGLPRPHQPIFDVQGIEAASDDAFFLAIDARDPQYDAAALVSFLRSAGATTIEELRP